MHNQSDQFSVVFVDVLDPDERAVNHPRKRLLPFEERVLEPVSDDNELDFSTVGGSETVEKVAEFMPRQSARFEVEVGGHVLRFYIVPPKRTSAEPDAVRQPTVYTRRKFG